MKLQAQPVFKDNSHKFIVLYPRGNASFKESINYKIVRKGLGKIDKEFKIPEHINQMLEEAQEHA